MSVDSVDMVDQCSDPLLTPYLRATLYACSSLMMVSLLPITSSFANQWCLRFYNLRQGPRPSFLVAYYKHRVHTLNHRFFSNTVNRIFIKISNIEI